MLSDLDLHPYYRKDRAELARDFYEPCLREATQYWRGVGFFTASALSVVAAGLPSLIARGGTMRLVASPMLQETDIMAIKEGYEAREIVVERALVRTLNPLGMPDPVRQRLSFLSWMIANGTLDIKIALLENDGELGDYHEKIGLFFDLNQNVVAFSGSPNESRSGLLANFERVDVFRSWIPEDHSRVPYFVSDFEALWNDKTPNLRILEFPEAARNELLRYVPSQRPAGDGNVRERESAHYVKIELKARQEDAVAAWQDAGRRGILEMATGSGKTIAAIACAVQSPETRYLQIAVPTVELVEQWVSELAKTSSFSEPIRATGSAFSWMEKLFRLLSLSNTGGSAPDPIILVGTYAALSDEKCARVISDAGGLPERSMIIADEVHNAGAASYRRALSPAFEYRLGLSATPVRAYDEEGSDIVDQYFSGTVFKFTIGQAIAARILCPYDYFVYVAELTKDEYATYSDITAHLGRLLAMQREESEESAKRLMIKRAQILKEASAKVPLVPNILRRHEFKAGLIYCADIDQASAVAATVSGMGYRVARYSSDDSDRRRALYEFGRGRLDLLVAVKCLDEGVDVPECDFALLLASDASERQFIQRRGRVLRRASDKNLAQIVDIIVTPPPGAETSMMNQELKRAREMIEYARNRLSATNQLAQTLAHFGVGVADLV